MAAASRSQGSQWPVARSGSPNGPWVVTAMTAADPVSIVSGIRSCAAGPPATFHCQRSATQSKPPRPASSARATGARRLIRYSHATRSEATAGRSASGARMAPGGELWISAAVMAAVPG